MPRPQDIQDLMDHQATTEGTHGMSTTPTAGGVPVAGSNGTINDGWISGNFAKKGTDGKISIYDLPNTVVRLDSSGKIQNGLLPSKIIVNTFQSYGSATKTNFLLADGTDLATMLVKSVRVSSSGSGTYVQDIKANLSSGVLTLTQTRGTPVCQVCSVCDNCPSGSES